MDISTRSRSESIARVRRAFGFASRVVVTHPVKLLVVTGLSILEIVTQLAIIALLLGFASAAVADSAALSFRGIDLTIVSLTSLWWIPITAALALSNLGAGLARDLMSLTICKSFTNNVSSQVVDVLAQDHPLKSEGDIVRLVRSNRSYLFRSVRSAIALLSDVTRLVPVIAVLLYLNPRLSLLAGAPLLLLAPAFGALNRQLATATEKIDSGMQQDRSWIQQKLLDLSDETSRPADRIGSATELKSAAAFNETFNPLRTILLNRTLVDLAIRSAFYALVLAMVILVIVGAADTITTENTAALVIYVLVFRYAIAGLRSASRSLVALTRFDVATAATLRLSKRADGCPQQTQPSGSSFAIFSSQYFDAVTVRSFVKRTLGTDYERTELVMSLAEFRKSSPFAATDDKEPQTDSKLVVVRGEDPTRLPSVSCMKGTTTDFLFAFRVPGPVPEDAFRTVIADVEGEGPRRMPTSTWNASWESLTLSGPKAQGVQRDDGF